MTEAFTAASSTFDVVTVSLTTLTTLLSSLLDTNVNPTNEIITKSIKALVIEFNIHLFRCFFIYSIGQVIPLKVDSQPSEIYRMGIGGYLNHSTISGFW